MTAEHFVRYEIDGRVAVITLDRPAAANAQTPGILADLDEAWRRADLDPEVRVIVLMTTGKHFSAGHDMSGSDPSADGRHLGPARAGGKLEADTYYDKFVRTAAPGSVDQERWRSNRSHCVSYCKRSLYQGLGTTYNDPHGLMAQPH